MKILFLIGLLPAMLMAQDTRKVVEPSIPASCTVLKAKLARAASSIDPEDESKLDTARIQSAIDACAPGRAVVLQRASERTDAFLSGPLTLRKGVVLVVDRGAYLFASRNPRDYDRKPGVCGTITEDGRGCRALINGDDAADAGVMGDGVIDGRGGEPILGQSISWWNLADQARKGGSQNAPRLMVLNHCDNFTLYRITLMNSPNFHVGYNGGNGFTVWGIKIWTPERARNTDGIDPGNSTNVTITHCYIHTGDDHVAIKAGTGKPTTNMSIVHNHFYTGHGMSIGSQTDGGASAIFVSDLSVEGADNALRIKSNVTRGGLVHDVVYEDVCIRDTANPIIMDTSYTAHVSPTDNKPPTFRDITVRNVRIEGGGKLTLGGYDKTHRVGIQFDNVVFDSPDKVKIVAAHSDVKSGPGAFNLKVSGDDITQSGAPGQSSPNACASKFEPFPLH